MTCDALLLSSWIPHTILKMVRVRLMVTCGLSEVPRPVDGGRQAAGHGTNSGVCVHTPFSGVPESRG